MSGNCVDPRTASSCAACVQRLGGTLAVSEIIKIKMQNKEKKTSTLRPPVGYESSRGE